MVEGEGIERDDMPGGWTDAAGWDSVDGVEEVERVIAQGGGDVLQRDSAVGHWQSGGVEENVGEEAEGIESTAELCDELGGKRAAVEEKVVEEPRDTPGLDAGEKRSGWGG